MWTTRHDSKTNWIRILVSHSLTSVDRNMVFATEAVMTVGRRRFEREWKALEAILGKSVKTEKYFLLDLPTNPIWIFDHGFGSFTVHWS